MIYRGYFSNINAFSAVNVTFYDAVNTIHDVIKTANPFPYTSKSMFVSVEIIKLNKADVER